MMNIAFKKAESAADIALIAQTARIIWRETYLPILGREQVDYMIEKFQSASALTGQLASGYVYDIIFCVPFRPSTRPLPVRFGRYSTPCNCLKVY